MPASYLAILDNPVWSALSTKQLYLRQGGRLAVRFPEGISPFAALANYTMEAFEELSLLIPKNGYVLLKTLEPISFPAEIEATHLGSVLQMVATGTPGVNAANNISQLNIKDNDAMIGLAKRTSPGPFGERTQVLGNFIGIREGGDLIAMAGERMQLDGYVEISAVCVDDKFRGRGLAANLVNILRQRILDRGDTPFLHVFEKNFSAISLYKRLGFETRTMFFLYRLTIRNSKVEIKK